MINPGDTVSVSAQSLSFSNGISFAKKGDRLLVLAVDQENETFQVRNLQGATGWVTMKSIRFMHAGISSSGVH
jgi:hypothetical protein